MAKCGVEVPTYVKDYQPSPDTEMIPCDGEVREDQNGNLFCDKRQHRHREMPK